MSMDMYHAAKSIQAELRRLGVNRRLPPDLPGQEDSVLHQYYLRVSDPDLRAVTEELFRDGHYARAVEEGLKCLNNYVKGRTGVKADGATLMRTAFSSKKPLLRLNALKTQSQRDEQAGYMDIFAGAMTGIRNPRAHEHRLRDSAREALDLLHIADHLFRKARLSVRPRKA